MDNTAKSRSSLLDRMLRRSFSRDMTFSLVVLLILVMALLFLAEYTYRSRAISQEMKQRADNAAQELADILTVPVWTFDDASVAQVAEVFTKNELVAAVVVRDSRKRVLYMIEPDPSEPIIWREQNIRHEGGVIGTARVGLTSRPSMERLDDLLWTIVIVFSGVVLVLALATGLLVRLFVQRPLRLLMRGMDNLARGNFSSGFPKTRHKDISKITERFTFMAAEVQARETALEAEVQERRRAQERYGLAVRGANDGIWDWDLITNAIYYSPRWKEIIGFQDHEFENNVEEWKRRIHPQDRERVVNDHQNYMAGLSDELELEYRLRHRNGTYRWIYARGSSLMDGAGEPVRIAGANTDITLRKQAEEELRKSEELFRTHIETTSEGYVQMDAQTHIVAMNKAFCDMIGYEESELLGESPLRFMDAENAEIVSDKIDRWDEVPHRTYEFTFLRKDGEDLNVICSATTFFDTEGNPAGSFALFTNITERKRMETQLRHQAMHDPLTGLANRTLCMDRIRQALERSRRRVGYYYAIMFVDLDRFKVINDSLGHAMGDKLLQEVSARLLECVRDLDTVARYGGDEFVVLLEELNSPRKAIQVVKRMREGLRRPFTLAGHEIQVTASIGIVLGPIIVDKPEDLLQYSNIAMHRAKAKGRDRFKAFNTRLLDHAMHMMTLEKDMDRALAEGQFFLEFQPIVRISGGKRLCGFEALVRWNHPRRGVIPPSEFIPVAEDTGLITDLGIWVLRQACQTMQGWRKKHDLGDDIHLAVNISGRQFSQVDLPKRIRRALRETGMPARVLKLEITETAIMENAVQAIGALKTLKNMGVTLSVDDFGTGYSSMSYLQRLPLDNLKIDLSFVQMLDVAAENIEIVKAIVNLAHTLNLEVVAEGVERLEHEKTLVELGCEYCQGYYYSRPVPKEKAEALLQDQSPLFDGES